ncbi:DAYSLEEPER [Hibiscus trionum]|uniref:DAYSLEEPER n=1 Tax=Hibiscus trionum TaxID=183268 RepID=A0A9W7LMG6_HIBTR|nr:DAYSLEEPER [Hibiscus trionum]
MKVRALVRFVRSSPARLQKFKACIEEEKEDNKNLVTLDVETRWNSTFLMLESAIKFKKAFASLYMKDSSCFKELRKFGGGPKEDDWKRVGSFLPFLIVFYDATLRLSGSLYVTSNTYAHEIYGTRLMISNNIGSEDDGVRKMAAQMMSKYDKYYGNVDNTNVLVFVGVILDSRHKLSYVDWIVRDSYDETKATFLCLKIKVVLQSLFDLYASSMPLSKTKATSSSTSIFSSTFTQSGPQTGGKIDVQQLMTSKYERDTGCSLISVNKNELEKYLEEACEPHVSSFEILQWWKDHAKRYLILHKMAKDVLAIPISTIASESTFSTGGRVLDSFRTSLTPKMVEALVCTQDRLRTSRSPLMVEENLLALKELEEGMKELTLEQPEIIIDETINTLDDF